MMRRMRWCGILGAAILMAVPTAAQQVEWGASVRPRAEAREVDDGASVFFTGMQTRASLARALNSDARIFVQVQDVRIWGEEISTLEGSADAFDLHQGYLELGHRGESPLWLRAGRQEMEFGNGRLVGYNPWSNVGRSFDGVRGAWNAADATVVDFFGMQLRESLVSGSHAAFFGAWSRTDLGSDRILNVYALHDVENAGAETARTTLGTEYHASAGIVDYQLEGAFQTGEADGLDVSAYLLTGHVTAPILEGRGFLGAGYERYSGNADPEAGETEAFSDLFGRNHRFLGFADLFSDIPSDTDGRGIQDVVIKGGWNLPKDARLVVDLHRFLVVDDEALDDSTLADELDVRLLWPAMSGIDVDAGISYVRLGDGGEALGLADGDVLFGYLMLTAAF